MTAKELKKIIALCKSEGLVKLKTKDVDLEFAPQFLKPKVIDDYKDIETEDKKYSDSDYLFWSVSDHFMNEVND